MSTAKKTKAAEDAAAILDSKSTESGHSDTEVAVDSEVKVADLDNRDESSNVEAKPAAKPIPKELLEQLDEIQKLYDNVQQQIEDFKSGQGYLPGDVPVTLHGLAGPGYEIGQRRLNWIDEKHLDSRLAFRWCNKKPEIIGGHIGKGRWPVQMDDFLGMVKARGGVATATTYKLRFHKSPEGYVAIGDLILMACTKEQNEALKGAVARRTANLEGTAKGNLYAECERLGTEPIEGELSGPKLQRIVSMLEKELGPGVRRVFLGG